MKAVLLFTVVAAMASASVVNAQQGQNCDQIVGQINNVAGTINQSATSYWAHRANFVDLIFGPSSQVVPNAMQVAEQEKAKADPLKARMPGRVNSLKGLVTAYQAQGCDPKLSAVTEPAHKQGKRVNFDQFPPATEPEELTSPAPPRMPR